MIQDNQQSRFIQEQNERAGGEEKGTAGGVQGKTKVSFINTDDTFIQTSHNHPSSHPIIKHYATLRTHAPCHPPSYFYSKHALVLRRVEICKLKALMLSDLMLLDLMYSGGLGMDLKENRVAVGHKECHGIINHHGSDSCSQLSLTIQLTSKKTKTKCLLQKRTLLCLYKTGQVKTVYPGILKENTIAYQSHWHKD